MKYTTAKHCGSIKECLETEMPISKSTAEILIKTGIYNFYAYDERIKAHRYIIVDMQNNLGLPQWIHIYK